MEKSNKIILSVLLSLLVLLVIIFPSPDVGTFKGSTIGKIHSIVQNFLVNGFTEVTGAAINVKETASSPIYAIILLLIALVIFILLLKKK
jgi:hypothetical protein